MGRMTICIPHQLGAPEALSRMRKFVTQLRADHAQHITHVTEQWDDSTGRFHLHIMGIPVQAAMTVGESEVHMEGNLPWAASLFRARIESTIREEVEKLLK